MRPACHIYVLSNGANVRLSQYKIGVHTGDRAKLLRRYKTSLIDPTVYAFQPCVSPMVERIILATLDDQRVRDPAGKKTEWIHAPLLDIINAVCRIIYETNAVVAVNIKVEK